MNRKREALKLIGVLASLAVGFYGTGYFRDWYTPEGYRQSMASSDCRANLKMLDSAKEQWALDHHAKKGAVVPISEIVGKDGYLLKMPVCPCGGVYDICVVGINPRCTILHHDLKPRR